jgi:nicotinamidase-related amidase
MKKIVLLFCLAVCISIFGYVFAGYSSFSSVSKGSIIPRYKNPKTALLVIDIQRDLTEKDGKAVLNPELTDKIIENTNAIITKADKLKLTVIYIRHEFKKDFLVDQITKGALREGSQGAQIDPRIIIANRNIFTKNIMDSFSNKEFEKFLQQNEIDALYITGIDARACVDRTIKAALNRKYQVCVIEDCIASKTSKDVEKKLEEFKKLGADSASSQDIINNLAYGQVFYK